MRQLVERNLITIGEAINRLRLRDLAVANRITAIPQIIGMRNVLIHMDYEIDYARVWGTVDVHLVVLHREVETLLEEGDREDAHSIDQ